MSAVTVCVLAYRSGRFLSPALLSVQRQTHTDLVVEIAVDPPASGPLELVAPFLSDDRFRVRVNPERLGWDGNIRALISRVETPFFLILPHDDVLHHRYVELLLREVAGDRGASVAYADMYVFGACAPHRKLVDLPRDGTREEQLLEFFLAGAEAVPWRGVTRSEVIPRLGGFPTDGFLGFAVECEWALGLIVEGRAIRVPRPIYCKRILPPSSLTASRERIEGQGRDRLLAAWERHRAVMLARTAEAVPATSRLRPLIDLAAEAAMIRRLWDFTGHWLPGPELRRAEALLATAGAASPVSRAAGRVAEMLREFVALHGLVGCG